MSLAFTRSEVLELVHRDADRIAKGFVIEGYLDSSLEGFYKETLEEKTKDLGLNLDFRFIKAGMRGGGKWTSSYKVDYYAV